MKRLVIDIDNTICVTTNGDYKNSKPVVSVIEKINEYKEQGFEIVLSTSRNMRTYSGNVGLINANTLPILVTWLKEHNVIYDEIHVAKPWCGHEGFYVDDRSIRPSEFCEMTLDEIYKKIKQ